MIVYQSCGKSLVSLYAGSTTALINIHQINREHVHSPLALPLPVERQLKHGGSILKTLRFYQDEQR